MRTLRAYFIDVAGKRVDVTLSAKIFATVLGIRMAGRPASVGAFANNVQEFESFREFVTSATITTLVDLPFAIAVRARDGVDRRTHRLDTARRRSRSSSASASRCSDRCRASCRNRSGTPDSGRPTWSNR